MSVEGNGRRGTLRVWFLVLLLTVCIVFMWMCGLLGRCLEKLQMGHVHFEERVKKKKTEMGGGVNLGRTGSSRKDMWRCVGWVAKGV